MMLTNHKFDMKNIGLSLLTLVLSGSIAFGQASATKKPTPTAPKSSTATKPASTKTAAAKTSNESSIQSANRTPTTKPASTTQATTAATTPVNDNATGNKMQEMYDQYHGVNQSKTSSGNTTTPANSKTKTANKATKAPVATKPEVTASTPSMPEVAPTEQSDDIAGFRIGIRGGASYLLPLEEVAGATYETAIGYHGGLVLNFGRGIFSFQPEINYSQQKVKASATFQGQGISLTATENRIEVPLLLKFSFGNPAGSRFFVNVGPYGSYALNGMVKGNVLGIPVNEKVTYDGSEGRISYGAAGGIGVALKLGPGHLTIEARGLYELGNNAPKTTTVPGDPTSSVNTNEIDRVLLQGSLGYLIPIGGR